MPLAPIPCRAGPRHDVTGRDATDSDIRFDIRRLCPLNKKPVESTSTNGRHSCVNPQQCQPIFLDFLDFLKILSSGTSRMSSVLTSSTVAIFARIVADGTATPRLSGKSCLTKRPSTSSAANGSPLILQNLRKIRGNNRPHAVIRQK